MGPIWLDTSMWERHSPAAVRLYSALASLADPATGIVTVGLTRLCQETHMGRGDVCKRLARMVETGDLVVEKRGTSTKNVSRYALPSVIFPGVDPQGHQRCVNVQQMREGC